MLKRIIFPKQRDVKRQRGGSLQHWIFLCKKNMTDFIRLRIYVSGMMSGQYTRFQKIDGPIWTDHPVHHCYCHIPTGLVAVVCTHSEGRTIYFNAELVTKMLVITKGISGSAFHSIPYRPKQQVWDFLLDVLKRFDAEDEMNKSKGIVVSVGTQQLGQSNWGDELSKLFSTRVKKGASVSIAKEPQPKAKAKTKVLKKPSKKC